MSVAELVAQLSRLPQDAKVELAIIDTGDYFYADPDFTEVDREVGTVVIGGHS